jgi:hypothetical protein
MWYKYDGRVDDDTQGRQPCWLARDVHYLVIETAQRNEEDQ